MDLNNLKSLNKKYLFSDTSTKKSGLNTELKTSRTNNTSEATTVKFSLEEAQKLLNEGNIDEIIKYFEEHNQPYKYSEDKTTGKITFSFEYQNHTYTHVFYSENVVGSSEEKPEEPICNESDGDGFSFGSVEKDASLDELYDKSGVSKIEDIMSNTMLGGTKGNVDAGGWDKLFAQVETMKPQFLEYIREQLVAQGKEYNESAAEKYLDVFITKAVQSYGDGSYKYGFNSINLPQNPTFEDLVNYIKEKIDSEIDSTTLGISPFSGEQDYYALDYYLVDTADFFLTEDEKKMKKVMEFVTDGIYHGTEDLDLLEEYLETYSKHVAKILKKENPELTEQQINSIIEDVLNETIVTNSPEKDDRNLYCINGILIKFEYTCKERVTSM